MSLAEPMRRTSPRPVRRQSPIRQTCSSYGRGRQRAATVRPRCCRSRGFRHPHSGSVPAIGPAHSARPESCPISSTASITIPRASSSETPAMAGFAHFGSGAARQAAGPESPARCRRGGHRKVCCRVERRRVAGRVRWLIRCFRSRAAVRFPWARFLPPLSEPVAPVSGTGLSSGIMRLAHGFPVATNGRASRAEAPGSHPCVDRPVCRQAC